MVSSHIATETYNQILEACHWISHSPQKLDNTQLEILSTDASHPFTEHNWT